LSNGHPLFGGNRPLARLPQLLDHARLPSKILLAADKNNGKPCTEMHHFRDPLLLYVIQRIGGVYSETDKDDMGIRVGEGSETIVVLLSSRIPKRQLNMFSVNLDIGNVILEYSWDVNLRECSLGEYNEQAGLSTSTISNDDKLPSDFRHV